jgi:hypothetical protein
MPTNSPTIDLNPLLKKLFQLAGGTSKALTASEIGAAWGLTDVETDEMLDRLHSRRFIYYSAPEPTDPETGDNALIRLTPLGIWSGQP